MCYHWGCYLRTSQCAAPMERKAGRYQAHMVLLSKDRARMHFYIRQWWQNVWHNKPHSMKLSLDIDPQELS